MTWQVGLHAEHPFIELTLSGEIDREQLGGAMGASLDLAMQHRIADFLCDCAAMSGGHSLFDLQHFARVAGTEQGQARFREALVLPTNPAALVEVRFWINACAKWGIEVRDFIDRESAIAWLLATQATDVKSGTHD